MSAAKKLRENEFDDLADVKETCKFSKAAMGRLEAACIDFQRDSDKNHLW